MLFREIEKLKEELRVRRESEDQMKQVLFLEHKKC